MKVTEKEIKKGIIKINEYNFHPVVQSLNYDGIHNRYSPQICKRQQEWAYDNISKEVEYYTRYYKNDPNEQAIIINKK